MKKGFLNIKKRELIKPVLVALITFSMAACSSNPSSEEISPHSPENFACGKYQGYSNDFNKYVFGYESGTTWEVLQTYDDIYDSAHSENNFPVRESLKIRINSRCSIPLDHVSKVRVKDGIFSDEVFITLKDQTVVKSDFEKVSIRRKDGSRIATGLWALYKTGNDYELDWPLRINNTWVSIDVEPLDTSVVNEILAYEKEQIEKLSQRLAEKQEKKRKAQEARRVADERLRKQKAEQRRAKIAQMTDVNNLGITVCKDGLLEYTYGGYWGYYQKRFISSQGSSHGQLVASMNSVSPDKRRIQVSIMSWATPSGKLVEYGEVLSVPRMGALSAQPGTLYWDSVNNWYPCHQGY